MWLRLGLSAMFCSATVATHQWRPLASRAIFFCAALLAAFQNGCPCLKYDTITRAGKGQGGTGGGSEWCCGACGHWDLADRHKKGKEEKRVEEEEEEQRRLGSKSRNWRILTWLKVRKCCCCCFCCCLL